jgi:hypothetical protein
MYLDTVILPYLVCPSYEASVVCTARVVILFAHGCGQTTFIVLAFILFGLSIFIQSE